MASPKGLLSLQPEQIDRRHDVPEIWKSVVGYKNLYEVSDRGQVRSLARSAVRRGRAGLLPSSGRILKPFKAGHGYLMVTLAVNGAKAKQYIHCLVAGAFIGQRPSGSDVCHNDGNRENNCLTNLRYAPRSANHLDKWRHGTMWHKYQFKDICTIRELYPLVSVTALAQRFNISKSQVGRIVHGASRGYC